MKVDKNHPSKEWIEHLRKRFPCETEIDRILTRKMRLRAGPPYSPVSLETLVKGTEALIRSEVKDDFRIIDANWLSGGASKLQMAFKLEWNQPGVGRTTTPMVLRMEPSASIVETSRLREFQMIKAMEGTVPVPPTYWVDSEGTYLPYPAIVYGFAKGVTKPSSGVSNVAGLGTNLGPALRPILSPQFIDHLSRIHNFDWSKASLSAFDQPAVGTTQAAEWQINCWERIWEEDSNEDIPLMRLAVSWLRTNMPPTDKVSVIHGDFRTGNFLYDESSNRITAFLDWETAHIGDRHEDIVYMTNAPYRVFAPDGKTSLLGGLMPEDAFYDAYEKASGLAVVPQVVNFYKVLNSLKVAAVTLAASYRAARGGKTHQDVLVAWVIGIAYVVMDDLRLTLEEVL